VAVYGDGDVRGCIYERKERQREMRTAEFWARERELEDGNAEFVSRLRLLVCFLLMGDLSYFCACTAYRTYSSEDLQVYVFFPALRQVE
jgi:hypothetical protein